jgi:hypothetical protein
MFSRNEAKKFKAVFRAANRRFYLYKQLIKALRTVVWNQDLRQGLASIEVSFNLAFGNRL